MESTRRVLVYEGAVSVLYAWCVVQAYWYDAKTQTGGIVVYALVYGAFTVLVRTRRAVLMMNILSAITLLWIFYLPDLQRAGGYFDFQPDLGIGLTVVVATLQTLLVGPLHRVIGRWMQPMNSYRVSGVIVLAVTLVLTIFVTMAPYRT